jgi:hypothetical protein
LLSTTRLEKKWAKPCGQKLLWILRTIELHLNDSSEIQITIVYLAYDYKMSTKDFHEIEESLKKRLNLKELSTVK